MPPSELASLWRAVSARGNLAGRKLTGAGGSVTLDELERGSCVGGRARELRGRSVLVWTRDQLSAALALIELDGAARRLVLCPSDFPAEQLPYIIESAAVDAVVSDREAPGPEMAGTACFVACSPAVKPANDERSAGQRTEWILLTSGTTGLPKLVAHTLASLAGPLESASTAGGAVVWSTFYDIRRYGGLAIFLRAALSGASMVLADAGESTSDFLIRAGAQGVTHISGTPSHWRRALMSPQAGRITPQNVRLSGEIADQAILNHLQSFYPQAQVVHAFASTEAGVAFEVTDGLAGFPARLIGEGGAVEMKVEDGSLRIRSARMAQRYAGREEAPVSGPDGFVDTGDMVDLRGDRYYFAGRRDGVINVGGLKVHPEEVEAVLNRHPLVRMSLVRTRKSPITGALVVADVVLRNADDGQAGKIEQDILEFCRGVLPHRKAPAAIHIVDELPVGATGKMVRQPCVMSS